MTAMKKATKQIRQTKQKRNSLFDLVCVCISREKFAKAYWWCWWNITGLVTRERHLRRAMFFLKHFDRYAYISGVYYTHIHPFLIHCEIFVLCDSTRFGSCFPFLFYFSVTTIYDSISDLVCALFTQFSVRIHPISKTMIQSLSCSRLLIVFEPRLLVAHFTRLCVETLV